MLHKKTVIWYSFETFDFDFYHFIFIKKNSLSYKVTKNMYKIWQFLLVGVITIGMFWAGVNKYIENWYLYLDYRDDTLHKKLAILLFTFCYTREKFPFSTALNTRAPVRFDNLWSVYIYNHQTRPWHLSKKKIRYSCLLTFELLKKWLTKLTLYRQELAWTACRIVIIVSFYIFVCFLALPLIHNWHELNLRPSHVDCCTWSIADRLPRYIGSYNGKRST